MIRDSFEDVVIEPQRAALIPGFKAVRSAAMSAGALGCSISGAGPTMFAWCLEPHARAVRDGDGRGVRATTTSRPTTGSSPIEPQGARVVELSG